MKLLNNFSLLQQPSLSPPILFEFPVKPTSLRSNFHFDRSTFWKLCRYKTPRLNLGPCFELSNLRKLQIERISFERQMHHDSFVMPQEISLIKDLNFIDCSPQTLYVLHKMLLSVKRLKRLFLGMNIPWPVVEF